MIKHFYQKLRSVFLHTVNYITCTDNVVLVGITERVSFEKIEWE
jgi:hypothetical protein